MLRNFGLNVLTELKSRDAKDAYLFCVDVLNGFREAINATFLNDMSLMKMLYLDSQNICKKWTMRYRDWDRVLAALDTMKEKKEAV